VHKRQVNTLQRHSQQDPSHIESSSLPEPLYDDEYDSDNKREVSFRSKGLTSDDLQSIATFFSKATELDLSDNKIEFLPRGVSCNLSALNLSKNCFQSFVGFDQIRNIRLLKLYGNKIERTWGLQACVLLEHLDLSNNKVQVIEGLETLTKLKTLLLNNNLIRTMGSIRPLSFNVSLEELSLVGNSIINIPNYRGTLKHLIASLKYLDGSPLFFRDGNRSGGYGVKFECRKTLSPEYDEYDSPMRSSVLDSTSEWAEVSMRWQAQDSPAPPPPKRGMDRLSHLDSSIISATPSLIQSVLIDEPQLPWRRPPNPIPRDRKGNEMYDPPPATHSPYRATITSNRHQKARKKKEKERAAAEAERQQRFSGKSSHRSTTVTSTSRISISTKSPSSSSASRTTRQQGHLSASAKAANIKYPVFQPRFSPPPSPPPPPPPPHRYKITLGKTTQGNGSRSQQTTKAMKQRHTHTVKDDVIRVRIPQEGEGVPLLASAGLREAVSPRKPIAAMHHTMSIDEEEGGQSTERVMQQYRAHARERGSPIEESQLHGWVPPPLPVEAELYAEYYHDESGQLQDGVSHSNHSESSYGHDEDSESDVSMSDYGDDDNVISEALRMFCEQKRETLRILKEKREGNKDTLLLIKKAQH